MPSPLLENDVTWFYIILFSYFPLWCLWSMPCSSCARISACWLQAFDFQLKKRLLAEGFTLALVWTYWDAVPCRQRLLGLKSVIFLRNCDWQSLSHCQDVTSARYIWKTRVSFWCSDAQNSLTLVGRTNDHWDVGKSCPGLIILWSLLFFLRLQCGYEQLDENIHGSWKHHRFL